MTNEEKFNTTEERLEAFNKFCDGRDSCDDCPICDAKQCGMSWLKLEVMEEDEPKP